MNRSVSTAVPAAQALGDLRDANEFPAVESPVTPLEQAFREYHEKNPWVYSELLTRARWLYDARAPRFGISILVEALRFDMAIYGVRWGISNSYRSLYARMLLRNNPWLDRVLRIRHAPALFHDLNEGF